MTVFTLFDYGYIKFIEIIVTIRMRFDNFHNQLSELVHEIFEKTLNLTCEVEMQLA